MNEKKPKRSMNEKTLAVMPQHSQRRHHRRLGSASATRPCRLGSASDVADGANSSIVPVPREGEAWEALHLEFVKSAKQYRANSSRLLLLGDSITERLRGSKHMGKVRSGAVTQLPSVLRRKLSHWGTPLVFGMGGDETQHVLWRMMHGEVSAQMAADNGLFVSLLIGTNNLGNQLQSPSETARGVEAVSEWILTNMRAQLLVQAVLPRGPIHPEGYSMGSTSRARCSLDSAIDELNERIRESVDALAARHGPRVMHWRCGDHFFVAGALSQTFLPDRLHPEQQGYEVLLDCVASGLAQLRAASHLRLVH